MSASRDRIDTKDVSRRGTKLSESWYARSLVWLLMSEGLWSCSESGGFYFRFGGAMRGFVDDKLRFFHI